MTDRFPNYCYSKPCDLCGEVESMKGYGEYKLHTLIIKGKKYDNVCLNCINIVHNYEHTIKRDGWLLAYDEELGLNFNKVKYNNKFIFFEDGRKISNNIYYKKVNIPSILNLKDFKVIFKDKDEESFNRFINVVNFSELIGLSKKYNQKIKEIQKINSDWKLEFPEWGVTDIEFDRLKKIIIKEKEKKKKEDINEGSEFTKKMMKLLGRINENK